MCTGEKENYKVNVNGNIWRLEVKSTQEFFVLFLQVFGQFKIISKQKVERKKEI